MKKSNIIIKYLIIKINELGRSKLKNSLTWCFNFTRVAWKDIIWNR